MVIPVPGAPLTVTIVYDVETADPKMLDLLSDGVTTGLSIEHCITRTVLLQNGSPMYLLAGKRYKVSLRLGLSGVEFAAGVDAWTSE